jgi:2-polyprenyl-6-hydroxyphenyl methylase / 3-demethylubiquinone-9 3-methyltransferase
MANIDPGEIAKFEALAHRWWDPVGDFRPLHEMNPLRVDFIAERCPLHGARVVDVGCGGGILTEALASLGAAATGIDMGEAPLAVARLHALESGLEIDYRQTTAEALAAAEPESFDAVTCMEMLEHVPDPDAVVAACARMTIAGGHLFFSTINRNPKSYAAIILGAEYLLRVLPKGTHDYRKLIRPSELARAVRNAGLETVEIVGMRYNPFTHRARLSADVDVNYFLYARKP